MTTWPERTLISASRSCMECKSKGVGSLTQHIPRSKPPHQLFLQLPCLHVWSWKLPSTFHKCGIFSVYFCFKVGRWNERHLHSVTLWLILQTIVFLHKINFIGLSCPFHLNNITIKGILCSPEQVDVKPLRPTYAWYMPMKGLLTRTLFRWKFLNPLKTFFVPRYRVKWH